MSWGPAELGGWIRHQGWTLRLDPSARLMWPVYPYNPYAAVPETSLGRAIGVISVPVKIDRKGGMEPMGSKFQEISSCCRITENGPWQVAQRAFSPVSKFTAAASSAGSQMASRRSWAPSARANS